MRKRIFTFLACVLFAGFAQAQVLFDPADFAEGDSVGSGKIVLLDSTKYLQVVVNGWNSSYTLPEVVKTINCAGIEATFKFAIGDSSIAKGWGINAAVQANDLLVDDQVEASWDPTQKVNSTCGASTASTAAADFVTVRGSFDENVMTQINELQFFGQETTNYGPTTGDTLWVGVVKLVYAPGILFEPQNASIGTLVKIGDEYYRQIVLDGWNSAVDIATVSTSGYAGLQAKIMASVSTTIPEGKTINFNVQANDTLKADQVEASWDATQTVNITCGAGTAYESCKELVEVSNNFSNTALTEIHQLQFFGQNTWNYAPVSGDTLYVSTVTLKSALTDDPTVVFDPADYELEDYTDEIYEIVEVDGAKYMKVVTDGTWDQVVDINEWFNVGEYNKVKGSLIVRNSSTYADDAVYASAQFITNGSPAGFFTGNSVGTNPVTGNYNSGDVVNQIQFFGQNTDDWAATANIEVYIGKITAYYEQPDTADAPATAIICKISGDAEFNADALQSEDFWGDVYDNVELLATDNGNKIARIAVDEKDKFEVIDAKTNEVKENSDSYGYWAGAWDENYIYFWVDVYDNQVVKLSDTYDDLAAAEADGAATWMNDCIELFLDINNGRIKKSSRGAQQFQMRFNVGFQGPGIGTDNGNILSGTVFGTESNDTTNVLYATNTSGQGWTLEVAVPWASLMRRSANTNAEVVAELANNPIKVGKKIACEISIADAETKDGRESILNWANNTGEDQAYNTAEFWGEITLANTDGTIDAISSKVARSLNIVPNPATDVITVDGDVISVSIYSLDGKLVKASSQTVVNVNDLKNGLYIVKAADKSGNVSVAKLVKK